MSHKAPITNRPMQRKPDYLQWAIGLVFAIPVALVLGYLVYLFISVVFLGGSSACPQNSC